LPAEWPPATADGFFAVAKDLAAADSRLRQPFVIGMTPSGIVALDTDFAERVGVRRPAYR
jgi:hypothetical protein